MGIPVQLRPLPSSSVGELLTLQRAAYVTEAQLYDDPLLPALTQSMDDLLAELAASTCIGAWTGSRLVGAVRGREEADTLHVGRLVVAPDVQGSGIGTRLLDGVEATSSARTARLFTGHLSAANLRLYRRKGYTETHREELRPGVQLVHLAKHLTGHPD